MANSKSDAIAKAGTYRTSHSATEAKIIETAESYAPAETANWASTDPATITDALDRIAAALAALYAKLDADAGVTDTDYASTLLP